MPLLDARGLKRTLGARTLLDGLSFTIEEGERVGLVGPNGCGKSTLGRILAGLDAAESGEIVLRRGARVAYLEQEPTFDETSGGTPTALEAVLAGLSEWQEAMSRHRAASDALARGEKSARWLGEMERAAHDVERLGGWDREHEARSILGHLGIEGTDARVDRLSGGERRRVALARLLVSGPDLAILDEPTNHLDVDTIEWLERHLAASFRGAVLLVTHDRWFLNQVVARTLELERGQLYSYEGGWEEYLEAKAERLAHAERAEQSRQNLLRRELDWLRRTPSARTGKQKARIQRAEHVMGTAAPMRERRVELAMESVRSGKSIVELEDVVIEVGGARLIDGLTLSMTKGERMGVIGPNGCGKSTLLRAILGELAPSRGRVVRGSATKIAYLDQERRGLDPALSVRENVAPGASRVDWAGRRVELTSYLDRMLFDGEQQKQPVGSLSGGERARVLLAKLLLMPANLLILDEPTNDLDAPTLAALEEMLVEMDATAIVVTHDRWFLERVATSVLAFEPGGKVRRWPGGYSAWRAVREEPVADKQSREPPREAAPKPKKGGLSFTERHELDALLPAIEAMESEVAGLETELADPNLYSARASEVPALFASLEARKSELARKMARWEELEGKRESSE
ncbi:MAG: ABC-F family ATP-binding cassette domain-containing protein [Sandaracinaceae bacterium]|nr:ABC-F family ATP-binding cassette domain-containing protein [Sandaracinaceae bacterium]